MYLSDLYLSDLSIYLSICLYMLRRNPSCRGSYLCVCVCVCMCVCVCVCVYVHAVTEPELQGLKEKVDPQYLAFKLRTERMKQQVIVPQ